MSPEAPLAVTVPLTSLVFDDLDPFENSSGMLWNTSLFELGFWEEDHRDEWHSPHIKGVYLSTQISLISSPHHLAKVQFPGFSLWTFYFQFPTFHAVTFRRKSPSAAHTEGGVCCKHWCSGVCLNISLQMSWGNTRWTSRLDGEPLCTVMEMILLKNDLKTPCTCKTLDWSSSDYALGHTFFAPGPIIFWLSCSAIEIPSLEKWTGFCPLQIAENAM